MKLNELRDNPGARKKRMRVGRGPGSGKGKMGGRGIKGQTSRSGVAIKGFEGGQMPIHRRLPKRGFTNIFKKSYAIINLGTLQQAIEAGKLSAGDTVTEDMLVANGVIRRRRDGVRLLGRGELNTKLSLEITGASKSAVEAIEKAGGSVKLAETAKAGEGADATA
ncbi:MAG: 50S ribosomal protein L15 [Pseudomonadota bacterium]